MNEWKIRQEVYHRINLQHTDDLSMHKLSITDDIVSDAIRYFLETDIGWIYPSKSYMVGICYAKWLAIEFGGSPQEYLDDPTLLYGNDPYFVPYSDDPATYDQILDKINNWEFNETLGMVPDVKEYFIKEFMIDVE
jgi:hypothetical protein